MSEPKPTQQLDMTPVPLETSDIQTNPEQFAEEVKVQPEQKEKISKKEKISGRAKELAKKTKEKTNSVLKMSTGMKVAAGIGGLLLVGALISKMGSSKKETEKSNGSLLKTVLTIGGIGAGAYFLDKHTGVFGRKYSKFVDKIFSDDEDKEKKKKKDKKEDKEDEKTSRENQGPPEGYTTYKDGIQRILEGAAPELRKDLRHNKKWLTILATLTGTLGSAVEGLSGATQMTGGAFIDLAKGTVDTVTGHPIASVLAGAAVVSNIDKIKVPEKYKYLPKDPNARAKHFEEMFKTEEVQEWLDQQDIHINPDKLIETAKILGDPDKLQQTLNEHVNIETIADIALETMTTNDRKKINSHNITFLRDFESDFSAVLKDDYSGTRETVKKAIKNAVYKLKQNSIEKGMTEAEINKHRQDIFAELMQTLEKIDILDIKLGQDNIYRFAIKNEEGITTWADYEIFFVDPTLPTKDQADKSNDAGLLHDGHVAAALTHGLVEGLSERLGSAVERVKNGDSIFTIVGGEVFEMNVDGLTTHYIGPFKLFYNLAASLIGDDNELQFATALQEYGKGVAAMAALGTAGAIGKIAIESITKGPTQAFRNLKNGFGFGSSLKAIGGWAIWPYNGGKKIYNILRPPIREMLSGKGVGAGLSSYYDNMHEQFRNRISLELNEMRNAGHVNFVRNIFNGKEYRRQLSENRANLIERQKVYDELIKHRLQYGDKDNALRLDKEDRLRFIKRLEEGGGLKNSPDILKKVFPDEGGALPNNELLRRYKELILEPAALKVDSFKDFHIMENIKSDLNEASKTTGAQQKGFLRRANKQLKKLGFIDLDVNIDNIENVKSRLTQLLEDPAEYKKATGKNPPSVDTTTPDKTTDPDPDKTPDTPEKIISPEIEEARIKLDQLNKNAPTDLEKYKAELIDLDNKLKAQGIDFNLSEKVKAMTTLEEAIKHHESNKIRYQSLVNNLQNPEKIEHYRNTSKASADGTLKKPEVLREHAERVKGINTPVEDVKKQPHDPDKPGSPHKPTQAPGIKKKGFRP